VHDPKPSRIVADPDRFVELPISLPDDCRCAWHTGGMASPQMLADVLADVTPDEYVRFVADWISDASDLDVAAKLTGDRVVDAIVAAAAAHVSYNERGWVPTWTEEPPRSLSTLWYPGPDVLFANALVHSPLLFTLHGVLVEADSLESV